MNYIKVHIRESKYQFYLPYNMNSRVLNEQFREFISNENHQMLKLISISNRNAMFFGFLGKHTVNTDLINNVFVNMS
jgi:hypothetical protein